MTSRPASAEALYARLREVLGDPHASTLMQHLTPAGVELATKADVSATTAGLDEVRQELGVLRHEFGELRGEFDHLRQDFGVLRDEFGVLRGEFDHLRQDFGVLRDEFGVLRGQFDHLRQDFGVLRDEFRRRDQELTDFRYHVDNRIDGLHAALRDQMRTYVLITLGAMTALTAAFAALVTAVV